MSQIPASQTVYIKEFESTCQCFISGVMWWVHEAMATTNTTCFSFSQRLMFPWLNPFLWLKEFSPQDSCKNANISLEKGTQPHSHGLSDSHWIQYDCIVCEGRRGRMYQEKFFAQQAPPLQGSGLQGAECGWSCGAWTMAGLGHQRGRSG